MYTCAHCQAQACGKPGHPDMPQNCPMRDSDFFDEIMPQYATEENHRFYITSTALEGEGYCRWPRLKETAEFCRRMEYRKVGLAFCRGLRKEARVVADLLHAYGLQVVSVMCKTGGIPKEEAGVQPGQKISADAFEPMCNPIAQAKLLNRQSTQFNIALGLCVGHDSMFYKHSDAMVTTLIAKDRVLAHNPAGAIYCAEGYFKQRLMAEED